jgi:hypothetical protein
MADKKQADPTVKSDPSAEFPEGTHPARPVSEVTHNAGRLKYRDNPDKPDESSIAQVVDIPADFPGQGVTADA